MSQISVNQTIRSIIKARRTAMEGSGEASAELLETQVYIGLNDAETKRQEHETDRYVSLLKWVCVQYGVPFSFGIINGGYIHDDGEYTEEKTIVLTFIDVEQETIDQIAKDLCDFFHQESVLITTDRIRVRTVYGFAKEKPTQ